MSRSRLKIGKLRPGNNDFLASQRRLEIMYLMPGKSRSKLSHPAKPRKASGRNQRHPVPLKQM